jgi:hypothetical protein
MKQGPRGMFDEKAESQKSSDTVPLKSPNKVIFSFINSKKNFFYKIVKQAIITVYCNLTSGGWFASQIANPLVAAKNFAD